MKNISKRHADALRESPVSYKTVVVRINFLVPADRADKLRQELLGVAAKYGAARDCSSCGGKR